MNELLTLTGIVLSAAPMGDYDKRVVVLTKERGKITAFAKGARRQNSALLAATTPFVFGTFSFYEGRSSYTMMQAEIKNYFQELIHDFEGAYYGFYFMEVADYYTRENNDEVQMLKLLYTSLRALTNPHLHKELVRCVFELKTMVINGEYPEVFCCAVCGTTEELRAFVSVKDGLVCKECAEGYPQNVRLTGTLVYTLQYIISARIEKLYTFTVSEEVLAEFIAVQEQFRKRYIGKSFKSLDILKTILNY